MNSKEKIVLQKVQDYFLTVQEIGRLYSTLLANGDFEGSVTAKFSLDGGSRTNTFNSKVESNVLKKFDLEFRINELSNDLYIIDNAINYINENEKEVIEMMIQGKKLSEIARKTGNKRKRVEKLRNSAIEKMTLAIDNGFKNTN